MASIEPTPQMIALRKRMIDMMQAELKKDDIPAHHVLAIFAYTMGQLIAMQDQRRFTSAQVMDLVSKNVEAGNRHAIEGLLGATGGHA